MTAPRDTGAARGLARPGRPAADAAAPTPEHLLAGAALIREGRMFRLARALPEDAAVAGAPDVYAR